jgi:hypothetical protein
MARNDRDSGLYQSTPLQRHFEAAFPGMAGLYRQPLHMLEPLTLLTVLKQSLSIDVRSGPSPPAEDTIMSSSRRRRDRKSSTMWFKTSGGTECGRSTVRTVPWQPRTLNLRLASPLNVFKVSQQPKQHSFDTAIVLSLISCARH